MKAYRQTSTRKIKIKNFRSIVMENPIEIRKINLLFGKNGSGKSSFIKAIRFLNSNLSPLNIDQTIYRIDKETNLGNYKENVFKNEVNNEICFDYEEKFESTSNRNYRIRTVFSDNADGRNLKQLSILNESPKVEFHIFPTEKNNKYDRSLKVKDPYQGYSPLTKEELEAIKAIKKELEDKLKNIDTSDKEIELSKNQDEAMKSDQKPKAEKLESRLIEPNSEIDIRREFTLFKNDKINKFLQNIDILPFQEIRREFKENNFFTHFSKGLKRLIEFTEEEERILNSLLHLFYQQIPRLYIQFSNEFHIGAVRLPPVTNYELINNKFSKDAYYGVPYEIEKFKSEYGDEEYVGNMELFINDRLHKLGFQLGVYVEKQNGIGSLFTIDRNRTKSNLAEASSGLIQLVPILVKMFMLDYNETYFNIEFPPQIMILEQPELHLHPSLQTKLTELISESEGSYIIETHSEHIVRKLQVLVAQGKISKDKVAVYYFDKNEKTGITSIKEMELEDDGFFKDPWPDGFFDDSYNLSLELLAARKN